MRAVADMCLAHDTDEHPGPGPREDNLTDYWETGSPAGGICDRLCACLAVATAAVIVAIHAATYWTQGDRP